MFSTFLYVLIEFWTAWWLNCCSTLAGLLNSITKRFLCSSYQSLPAATQFRSCVFGPASKFSFIASVGLIRYKFFTRVFNIRLNTKTNTFSDSPSRLSARHPHVNVFSPKIVIVFRPIITWLPTPSFFLSSSDKVCVWSSTDFQFPEGSLASSLKDLGLVCVCACMHKGIFEPMGACFPACTELSKDPEGCNCRNWCFSVCKCCSPGSLVNLHLTSLMAVVVRAFSFTHHWMRS